MWFLTQHKRWGLLRDHPDYLGVARQVNQVELYREAATLAGVAVPSEPMRRSTMMDGTTWDGREAARYADSFTIRHSGAV
jgi:nitrate/nitrite transport system substrate-binding protein